MDYDKDDPTAFMVEAECFVSRQNIGVPVPEACLEFLMDAVDVFMDDPDCRNRINHICRWADGKTRYDLLGMLSMITGLDLESMDHHECIIPVREHLSAIGLTPYDQLCLQEIDHHSIKLDVLMERVVRFAQTGERMPFTDDLNEYNTRPE